MKTKMMIGFATLFALGALTACGPSPPADTSAASAESPAAATADMSGMTMDSAAMSGKGVGEITAIDQASGSVTIKHDAIPEVNWPAMTMAFKANPASLLTGLKVGDKVSFDVSIKGSKADVIAIQSK